MNIKKAIPVYVFLVLMVVICAAYFGSQSSLFGQKEPAGGNTQSGESKEPVSSVAEEDLPDMYRYVSQDEHLPKPDVFAEGYTATVDDFRITINDVYVAKDTQGLPYPTYLSERRGETVDENGTLTSAHSYLFMDITVENQSDLARTFDISMSYPQFYVGEEWLDMQASFELATQSINNDTDPQSRYTYMMQAGERVTYTRAYIFPDEKLEQVTDLILPVTFGADQLTISKEKIHAWDPSAVMLNLTPLWPGGEGK